jgi:hypothetical protein
VPPLAVLAEDCHLFRTCNASICPVDPRWESSYHGSGEKVCHHLLATGKEGAADHYRDDAVCAAVKEVAGAVAADLPPRTAAPPGGGAARRRPRAWTAPLGDRPLTLPRSRSS